MAVRRAERERGSSAGTSDPRSRGVILRFIQRTEHAAEDQVRIPSAYRSAASNAGTSDISEEHIDRWLDGREHGAVVPITTLCDMALRWYADRLDPDWHPRTPEENRAILEDAGLTGEFWRLS
ncbi:MAG: hypothetical protein WD096_12130 [Actinomycetota bacterium]